MAERIGQQLGNYRLLQLIGGGGFADVYLGEHTHLGTQAAIKVLHTRLVSEGVEQFRREARTIARLEHPHIVRVLDFGVESGTPFLIMSYAPNGTLRQRHPKGTRVPLNSVISYVKQTASALQYAHEQHVIHRDVKPDNLLVGRNNEILLSDFGIALVTQSAQSQHTQEMAGTIAYMAPEQIEAHPCPNSDQYSLAVLTYEWLSGDRPFHGSFTEVAIMHTRVPPPPLHEKEPTLSPAVEQVVLTALSKDPEQRFATVQAFATALEDAAAFEQASRISGQDLLSPSQSVRSSIPSERAAPPRPSTAPAELMTPPSRPVPTTEVVSLSSPSVLPVLAASAEQAVLTQLPAQPSRRGLSRRAVLVGLAGVAVVGMAGTGLTWLFRSQAPQVSSPTLRPEPSPSLSPTSSSTIASSINSSGAMFGFDLQHTRFNPGERTLSAANVSHLMLYWTTPTGAAITSSPAVANGIVYIGSQEGKLYAFRTTDGTLAWSVPAPTGGQINSSPAVANDVVYIGSDDSNLYAFNATTGKLFWTVPFLTGGPIDSSPTVANGVVYVGSDDYKLHALDATTGKELWAPNTYYAINSSPAVSNGIVYIGSPDAQLYAFDAVKGGTLKWSASTGDSINSSPAVANGVVYIGSQDGQLYAFRATDGTLYWPAPAPTGGQIINSSPAVANGVVYIGSDAGQLYAFDAITGKLRWSTLIGKQIRSSPAVANGVVYIGSDAGQLYAFNAATGGNPLWSALIGKQIRSSPAVANGVVYIGSDDGKLYAFHLP